MKRAYGLSIPQTLEDVCDPQRIALLVYDMQVGILSQIKNGDKVTRQVLKVLTAARDARVRVFFSRHLSLPKELMGMFQFRMAMAWQRTDSPEQVDPWFLRDAPGFQIAPELNPRPSEGVFDKLTMSAFEAPGSISLCEIAVSTPLSSSASRPRSGSNRQRGTEPISVTFRCS